MKYVKYSLLGVIITCLLCSCARTIDLSHEDRYSPIIGVTNRTKRLFILRCYQDDRVKGVDISMDSLSYLPEIKKDSLIAQVPVGTEYRVIQIVQGTYIGESRIFMIGEVLPGQAVKSNRFMFVLGSPAMTESQQRDFP